VESGGFTGNKIGTPTPLGTKTDFAESHPLNRNNKIAKKLSHF